MAAGSGCIGSGKRRWWITTLTERHTLLNGQYRHRLNGVLVEEMDIQDEATYRHILHERFLIDLPPGAVLKPVAGIAP